MKLVSRVLYGLTALVMVMAPVSEARALIIYPLQGQSA
jgi:hypothetical protein